MPGLLATTVNQGYDYLSPYVEKAQPYVDKARYNVPLVDPALKKAEELVPALITRADELTEPQVEKMRPYVEPKIEQVRERVAPLMDKGVKQYGVLCKAGQEKVDQVKDFKDAKETQIREFAEPKIEKVKEFTEAKTTQIHAFADPKVEKIKEFTEAKTAQIREFTDPKIGKIKEFMEPKVAVITAERQKMQKFFRVPASLDLQSLKYETLLGKTASLLEKMEALMDRYLPLPEDQKKDDDYSDYSRSSGASDTSCVRINRSVLSIMARPVVLLMIYVSMLCSSVTQLKKSAIDGTLKAQIKDKASDIKAKITVEVMDAKAKITVKVETMFTKVTEKLAPKVAVVRGTSLFKKAVCIATSATEKMLGKEKTAKILSKVETFTPAAWKTYGSLDKSQ